MTTVTVIIVVLVLLALAAAAYAMVQKRRREQLQTRLGPEYDRQVEAAGSRRKAEQHLAGVVNKRDKLDVRDLDDSERARYTTDWEAVQARFVDEPGAAVDSAESLITKVMRERGYPVDDFEERADLVAVDHPDVVSHYREAHAAHERHRKTGSLDTEDLRQSFVHYRELFTTLVHPDTSGAHAAAGTTDTGTRTAVLNEDDSTAGDRREADAAGDQAPERTPEADRPVTDADGRPVTDSQGRPVTDADLDRHQETR
jgi:hypothetical protein